MINIIMNSDYSGHRGETGGGEIKRFISYVINRFLAF